MDINARIKKVRTDERLSQTKFAERIGIKQSSLSDIENGHTVNIDERTIKIICNEFGISDEWLRSGKGEMRTQTGEMLTELMGSMARKMSDIERQSTVEFMKLPADQKKFIMDFIKNMNR